MHDQATRVPAYLRAVATDLDGTLAEDGRLHPNTVAALRRARRGGVRVVVVTGRILAELDESFPGLRSEVDAIVGENGAVLATTNGSRRLVPSLPRELAATLVHAGLGFRSGEVIVAGSATDEATVTGVVRELGLDCSLVRNRTELMVLPAGVTKATGLRAALAELGLSSHNTVAVGDAENDLALFDACEVGVAVANAVPSLRDHADLVLAGRGGRGVAELLDGDLLAGRAVLHPMRWSVELGTDRSGAPVALPASQVNVLIAGGSGTGKSYLAGLVVEELIRLGYTAVVIDPEGDHRGLLDLPLVWTANAGAGSALPPDVGRLLQADHSVVVDLADLDDEGRRSHLHRLPAEIQAQRAHTGRPQWVVVDEAHGSFGPGLAGQRTFEPSAKGNLLVTWRPADLTPDTVAGFDVVLATGGRDLPDGLVELVAAVGTLSRTEVASTLAGLDGEVVLVRRDRPHDLVVLRPGRRSTPHHRHEHKYALAPVREERRFRFCRPDGSPTGASAGDLAELERRLAVCDVDVVRHHARRGDLSRWTREVLADPDAAAALAAVEAGLRAHTPEAVVEAARLDLIAVVQGRRPGLAGPSTGRTGGGSR